MEEVVVVDAGFVWLKAAEALAEAAAVPKMEPVAAAAGGFEEEEEEDGAPPKTEPDAVEADGAPKMPLVAAAVVAIEVDFVVPLAAAALLGDNETGHYLGACFGLSQNANLNTDGEGVVVPNTDPVCADGVVLAEVEEAL